MSTTSEVYLLVTLSNATLTSFPTSIGPTTFTGKLALECVTFNILRTRTTSTPIAPTRDVLLVLRLGAFEAPLDPARALTASVLPPSGARRYVFHATQDDAKFTIDLPPVTPENVEAVELFHSVLVGYTTNARGLGDAPARGADHNASAPAAEGTRLEEDLRGRFVLINEDNGEVVGALDGSVRVHEDPSLGERGHEKDPVVVELPEDADMLDDSEVLVRAIPPEERDWLVKGAVFVSHAISGTTTLLTSAMTSASNYYIAHTTPGAPSPTPPSSSSASPARASQSESSHTLLLLQSSTTRKHLTSIHAVSGSAVNLSNKAAAAVDSWIQRAASTSTAKDKGKGKPQSTLSPSQPLGTAADRKSPPPPQLPPRSRSRSPALPAAYPPDTKPPLPARNNKSSLSPSPSPLRTPSPSPSQSTSTTPPPLSTRVALSASLVLSSLAESSVRLVDAGGVAVSAAVAHKYGPAAGENVALAAGTVRNVVLVYVDVRGLGRRAIVERTAKTWVKGRVVKAPEGAAPRK